MHDKHWPVKGTTLVFKVVNELWRVAGTKLKYSVQIGRYPQGNIIGKSVLWKQNWLMYPEIASKMGKGLIGNNVNSSALQRELPVSSRDAAIGHYRHSQSFGPLQLIGKQYVFALNSVKIKYK